MSRRDKIPQYNKYIGESVPQHKKYVGGILPLLEARFPTKTYGREREIKT